MQNISNMNLILSTMVLMVTVIGTDACANHSPPRVPNSFLGTVQQGCSPGSISSVQKLRTDPSKCSLPAAPGGCDLCKLRLYLPESTTSRFLVQPVRNVLGLTHDTHIEGTACKCSDGCFFHKSSITKFGKFPLPSGITGRGTFSEPLACYSGSSMPNEKKPKFTYLIWCETDGGCPNSVVARFSHLIRFELLSPNRPTTKSIFTAKVTTLPRTKCIMKEMSERVRTFIQGNGANGALLNGVPGSVPGSISPQNDCGRCAFAAQCRSRLCFSGKCVKSLSSSDKAACGFPTPPTVSTDKCNSQNACIRACLSG